MNYGVEILKGFFFFDLGKFDGVKDVVFVFVVVDDIVFMMEGVFDGEVGVVFDEVEVVCVGGGGVGVVFRFLDEDFFGVEGFGELFVELFVGVYGV